MVCAFMVVRTWSQDWALCAYLAGEVGVFVFITLELDGILPEARIGALIGSTSLELTRDDFRCLLLGEVLAEGHSVVLLFFLPWAALSLLLALLGGIFGISSGGAPGISGRGTPVGAGIRGVVLNGSRSISGARFLGVELGAAFLGAPSRVDALFGVSVGCLLVKTIGCKDSHSTCDQSGNDGPGDLGLHGHVHDLLRDHVPRRDHVHGHARLDP